jgi:hypothetical protein
MAIKFVGGDKLVLNKEYITAAQNLCDKSLVCVTGSAPAAAAGLSYGVVEKDTKSGDLATVKNGVGSFLEVLATAAVSAGSRVEAYVVSTYAVIDGTSTAVTTCAGVMDLSSGFPVGIAHTASDAGGTVLVEWLPFIPKGAIA